jgi:DNA-binding NtrC family response regulator
MIRLQDLSTSIVRGTNTPAMASANVTEEDRLALAVGSFAEAERDLIARALQSTDGNKVAAAALLRISRKKLYAKIAKYGI